LPPLFLLWRIRAGGGVEEGEAVYPLGGLAHDFQRDIAAHRDAGEGEKRRGCCQNLVGKGGDGVVLVKGGDG